MAQSRTITANLIINGTIKCDNLTTCENLLTLRNDLLFADGTRQKSAYNAEKIKYINKLEDLPTPIDSVIRLEPLMTYIFTGSVDIVGNRFVTTGVCNLFGLSSETSFITSTGLADGTPLLTSEYTIIIESISFLNVNTGFSIGSNERIVALDWKSVNFVNIPNVGTLTTCDNFIFETGAFLNSKGLRITGTIGTVGIINSLFRGDGLSGSIFNIASTATITRRFRITYSSIIAFSNTTGIIFDDKANVPNEGYILDNVNFSGLSTYISGILTSSNKSLFKNCVGIENTAINGTLYTISNNIPTVIQNTTDFYKISGNTTPGIINEKYEATNNRLTNLATILRKYLVQATLSFTSGNNNVCQFAFYDSKISGIKQSSIVISTANGGRAENIYLHDVVTHSSGNYIEVWVKNTTNNIPVTVEQLNIIITEII